MPLHAKHTVRDNLLDDVYATTDLSVAMPKFKIPENEHDPRHAYQVVHDELMLDGNSRQNLATFCQTWVYEEVHKRMDESIDKNMIDKDEYPQAAEIEARCVQMLADLWNSPNAANTLGCSTTGSSEAAMLGGLALKWAWRKKQKAAGLPTDKPNMIGRCAAIRLGTPVCRLSRPGATAVQHRRHTHAAGHRQTRQEEALLHQALNIYIRKWQGRCVKATQNKQMRIQLQAA